METEITPEQKNMLSTWAKQRDSALLEISGLRTEKETLLKHNREISNSSSEIQTRMNVNLGRIEELNIKESELPKLLRKDIAELQNTKTSLQTETSNLLKEIESLSSNKTSLKEDINFSLATLDSLYGKAGKLEEVIGHVTQISTQNESIVQASMKVAKEGLEELVNKNKKVVESTDFILEELPKVFLEIQRKSLIREIVNRKKT